MKKRIVKAWNEGNLQIVEFKHLVDFIVKTDNLKYYLHNYPEVFI